MPSRSFHCWLIGALLFSLFSDTPRLQRPGLNARLLIATQNGDVASVSALLAKGAAVDASNEFGVTPLIVAADKGYWELVRLLVSHGGDVNKKDYTYGKTPLKSAIRLGADLGGKMAPKARKDRAEIIDFLLDKGATGGEALAQLIGAGYAHAARRVISRGHVDGTYLNLALASAKQVGEMELIQLLIKAGATELRAEDDAKSPARMKLLAGIYRSASGNQLTLVLDEEDITETFAYGAATTFGCNMMLDRPGRDRVLLLPLDLTILRSRDRKVVVILKTPEVPAAEISVIDGTASEVFTRIPIK